MNKISVFFLYLFISFSFVSEAQTKARIVNFNVENIKDSLLVFTFDFEKAKKNELFDFHLIAKEQGGNFIEPSGLTGDLKQQLNGKSKQIIWLLNNNLTDFNGFLKLQIRAVNSEYTVVSSESEIIRVHKEWKSSVINSDPTNSKLADIRWINPEKRVLVYFKEEFSIEACVSSETIIKEVNLYINNELISKDRAFQLISSDCPNTINKTFNLVDGLNEIKLEIIDIDGIKTDSFILVTRKE